MFIVNRFKPLQVARLSLLIFALTLSFCTGSKIPRGGRSRTHVRLRCNGIYDQQIFARLEQVCDTCFHHYKDPEVHGLCRYNIFKYQAVLQTICQ